MKFGVLFPPTLDTPEHIELAEKLGFEYAFIYDSPTFLADPWITLTDAASRTSSIILGISATTSRLRHVVTLAGAIATMRAKIPRRLVIVIGTGFTAQLMIGKKTTTWAEAERYVVALRALLAGEEIEWDDAIIGLRHGERTGLTGGEPVPLWVAAHGPKGYEAAARVADGIVTNPTHGTENVVEQAERTFALYYGTVLDDGETLDDPRVLDAAGPTAAFQLHLGGEGVAADSPEWNAFTEQISQIDERRRHLVTHGSHLLAVTELERPLVTGELIRRTTYSGTEDEVRANIERIAATGTAGILYGPQGSDIPRELRRFAEVAGLSPKS